jgi:hypothetical protein
VAPIRSIDRHGCRRDHLRVRRAAGISLLLIVLPAGAQVAAAPSIRAQPNPVRRGKVVRVHGAVPGCPRGDRVTLISRAFSRRHEFAGLPAVIARVGARSRYSVRTRIPARRKPGRYRITARCGGGNLGVSVRLRVLR